MPRAATADTLEADTRPPLLPADGTAAALATIMCSARNVGERGRWFEEPRLPRAQGTGSSPSLPAHSGSIRFHCASLKRPVIPHRHLSPPCFNIRANPWRDRVHSYTICAIRQRALDGSGIGARR